MTRGDLVGAGDRRCPCRDVVAPNVLSRGRLVPQLRRAVVTAALGALLVSPLLRWPSRTTVIAARSAAPRARLAPFQHGYNADPLRDLQPTTASRSMVRTPRSP